MKQILLLCSLISCFLLLDCSEVQAKPMFWQTWSIGSTKKRSVSEWKAMQQRYAQRLKQLGLKKFRVWSQSTRIRVCVPIESLHSTKPWPPKPGLVNRLWNKLFRRKTTPPPPINQAMVEQQLRSQGILQFRFTDERSPESVKIVKQLSKALSPTITLQNSTYSGLVGSVHDRYFHSNAIKAIKRWTQEKNKWLQQAYKGRFALMLQKREGVSLWRTHLLETKVWITNRHIKKVSFQRSATSNLPFIELLFTSKGKKIFGTITGSHIGHRMAVVLDQEINSTPVIMSKISGGRARITLGYTKTKLESARQVYGLIYLLRSGKLPFAPNILVKKVMPSFKAKAFGCR